MAVAAATPDPGTSQPGGQAGGEVVVAGCTPKTALIPGNTSETCGGDIIDAMASKLVQYNTENATPENEIAESIETSDNKLFTVKLKPYKFHDGTEVKAKNFVDAWNYTAYGPNGQAGTYFYEPFAGYADVQCPDTACKENPKAKTLSGLKVVDDTTFTIQTTEPVSNLPVRLGYSAFAPLPDSFFADPKAFEKKPIGSGPFKLDSISNTEYVLTKFADYSGATKANVDKLTFRIYQDPARPTPTPWAAPSTTSMTATSPRTSSSATPTRTTSPTATLSASRAGSAGSPSPPTIRSSRTIPTCARLSPGPSTGI